MIVGVVGGGGGGGVGHPGKLTPGKQGLGVASGHLGSSGLRTQFGMTIGGLVVGGHLESDESGEQSG